MQLWVSNLLNDDTPVDVTRYFGTRSGTLPGYPQARGRVSSSSRAFALSVPEGRRLVIRFGSGMAGLDAEKVMGAGTLSPSVSVQAAR